MSENKTTKSPTIKWDDTNIRNTYANICNITSSREEVSLMFGMRKNMDTDNNELTVELSDRIVLNPYAAKRLALLLKEVIDQYEEKLSKIELDLSPNIPVTNKKTQSSK